MENKVILSPHLDDAIFSCWSIIQNKNTTVITIFAGQPTKKTRTIWDAFCGEINSYKMMQKRKIENKTIMDSLYINSIVLNYLDNQYDKNRPTINQIMNEILSFCSSDCIFYVPLAISLLYRHPDHVITRNVGLALLERNRKVIFYADQPYMLLPTSLLLNNEKLLTTKIKKDLKITGNILVNKLKTDSQQRKLDCMKKYESQFKMTNLLAFNKLSKKKNLSAEFFFVPKA